MVGEEAHLLQLTGGEKRTGRLVREDSQCLQTIRRRQEPVLGLVRFDFQRFSTVADRFYTGADW